MGCNFCEGKRIVPDRRGNGVLPGRTNVGILAALCGFDVKEDDNYVRLDKDSSSYDEDSPQAVMWFNNSAGEYAELGLYINYCPICGKKLND